MLIRRCRNNFAIATASTIQTKHSWWIRRSHRRQVANNKKVAAQKLPKFNPLVGDDCTSTDVLLRLSHGELFVPIIRPGITSPSQWNALCKRDTTVTVGANRPAGFLKQIEERFDDVDGHRKHDRGILFGADLCQRL